ncbi:O-antigen export protein [Spirosoma terrae]|uniref:Oligosaccharide flippase family protein n=1 Tax=Spirosoma terrae TaxID=1968276 RepID=A0A6L9LGA4_9BACT|nr:oligosaccharide flippase family protein [Spirosoma terrae]NDU97578.1 oligosaccharide flippase family protein [Spirosoma terrae]
MEILKVDSSLVQNFRKIVVNKLDTRSKKVIENIGLSFFVKIMSLGINLVLVPMTINYINPVQYGIWLTISSVVSWMNFFDIGLGNGLRNKLTEAIALNDIEKAKIYLSTTYAVLLIISIVIFITFFSLNRFINWGGLFDSNVAMNIDINNILLLIVTSFCFQFVLQTINTVLLATHKAFMSSVIMLIGQSVTVCLLYLAKKRYVGSLELLVIVLTIPQSITLLLGSIYLFKNKMRYIAPNFKSIKFMYSKEIINLGGIFFVIQIGSIVLFQTNNVIIGKILGPSYVTNFNVTYKLFSVFSIILSIIITPYWSAFTDAYVKKDYAWMRKNVKIMRLVWLFLSFGVIITYFISDYIFKVWIGRELEIEGGIALAMSIYTIMYMWQTLHTYILNGIGNLKIQLIVISISSFISIPLAIMLGQIWGLLGIIISSSLIVFFISIILSVQVRKIMKSF